MTENNENINQNKAFKNYIDKDRIKEISTNLKLKKDIEYYNHNKNNIIDSKKYWDKTTSEEPLLLIDNKDKNKNEKYPITEHKKKTYKFFDNFTERENKFKETQQKLEYSQTQKKEREKSFTHHNAPQLKEPEIIPIESAVKCVTSCALPEINQKSKNKTFRTSASLQGDFHHKRHKDENFRLSRKEKHKLNKLKNLEYKNQRTIYGLWNNPFELSFGEDNSPNSRDKALEKNVSDNEDKNNKNKNKKNNKNNKNNNNINNNDNDDNNDNNDNNNNVILLTENTATKNNKLKTSNNFVFKKNKTINENKITKMKSKNNKVSMIQTKSIDVLSIKNLEYKFPGYKQVKYSHNEINEFIKCFAANTYKGLTKKHNTDKVSIILKISKPKNFKGTWPSTSFIGLYNGKFGQECCNFLRDKLHKIIIRNKNFPKDPKTAILQGFEQAEEDFMEKISDDPSDKSGSSAIIALLVENKIYVANCGDSYALLSSDSGRDFKLINKIHNINNNVEERERVIKNGGRITYTNSKQMKILPGKLSISRSFGYQYVRNEDFGGKENMIIETPEIYEYEINNNSTDFLILSSAGVFQKLTIEEAKESIENVINQQKELYIDSIHQLAGSCTDMLLKTALIKGSLDNVTAIFLGFPKFKTDKDNFSVRNVSKSTDVYKRVRDKERTLRITNKITIDSSVKKDKNNKISIKEVEDNSNSNIMNEKENLNKITEEKSEDKNEEKQDDEVFQRKNVSNFTIRQLLADISTENLNNEEADSEK